MGTTFFEGQIGNKFHIFNLLILWASNFASKNFSYRHAHTYVPKVHLLQLFYGITKKKQTKKKTKNLNTCQ